MEVDLGEPGDHHVQEVSPLQAGDLDVEVELLENLASPRGKAGNVATEVAGQLPRVLKELPEVERRGVVETWAGDRSEDRIDILPLSSQLECPSADGWLPSP